MHINAYYTKNERFMAHKYLIIFPYNKCYFNTIFHYFFVSLFKGYAKLIKILTNYNYETASYNYDWHLGDFFAYAYFCTANQLLGK